MREGSRDELVRETNHFGEQAALAYLDGAHGVALAAADRATRAAERLHQADRDDRGVAAVYAERLRDRAEIRCASGGALAATGRAGEAQRLYRGGVDDGRLAIELHESVTADAGVHPLWSASVRLLVGELHGRLSDGDAARREGELALAAYRARSAPDEDGTLDLARATQRHAAILARTGTGTGTGTDAGTGTGSEVVDLHRQALALYRRHDGTDGWLWRHRHARGMAWRSTPTWERRSRAALSLADSLRPAGPAAAREALLALQDAAEGFAALVPDAPLPRADPEAQRHIARLGAAVTALAGWLTATGHDDLARTYDRAFAGLTTHGGSDWYATFLDLRARLTDALPPP